MPRKQTIIPLMQWSNHSGLNIRLWFCEGFRYRRIHWCLPLWPITRCSGQILAWYSCLIRSIHGTIHILAPYPTNIIGWTALICLLRWRKHGRWGQEWLAENAGIQIRGLVSNENNAGQVRLFCNDSRLAWSPSAEISLGMVRTSCIVDCARYSLMEYT